MALDPACPAEKFTPQANVACKLALHRVVSEKGKDCRDQENRFVFNTVPCPDPIFLTRPEKGLEDG